MLCGAAFELALKHSRVSRRCLQLWIWLFNSAGINSLTYRPKSGRPRKFSKKEVNGVISPVIEKPSLADQLHWTGVKFHGWLRENKDYDVSYRTTIHYLHELGYKRVFPRPVPLPGDPEDCVERRDTFVLKLFGLLEDNGVDVFFCDEAGFEGNPRPRQRWVKRGCKPVAGYNGGHVRSGIPQFGTTNQPGSVLL